MSEKVWRGRLGDFPAFSTPDDFSEQDDVVLSHSADYDALQARVAELGDEVIRLESIRRKKCEMVDHLNDRIDTLETELAQKTAECERLQAKVSACEVGSPFSSNASLLSHADQLKVVGSVAAGLEAERDTALRDLATANEELSILRNGAQCPNCERARLEAGEAARERDEVKLECERLRQHNGFILSRWPDDTPAPVSVTTT